MLNILSVVFNYNDAKENISVAREYNFVNLEEIKVYDDDTLDYITNPKYKHKWNYVKKLEINYQKNNEFISLNDFKNLRILNCIGSCGVNDKSISKLKNIVELNCSYNSNIKCIKNFGNTLKKLTCSGVRCSIDQKSISELKILEYLDCENNEKIYDVNHLASTLKILNCSINPLIHLMKLKVINLGHKRVYDVERQQELDYLDSESHAENNCTGLTQLGISKLINLEILTCYGNKNINNIKIFPKLIVDNK